MSYTKAIQKMIDDGNDVLQIAKLFGGINRLVQLSKASPYLTALIQTKLGGYLQCSAEDEDEVMVAFNLDFVISELEKFDDFVPHYNASLKIIVPELTEDSEMQMLYSWLEEYLMDLGSEVANYNDKKLQEKMIWVYVDSINGKKFKRNNDEEVSDIQILRIIPSRMKD